MSHQQNAPSPSAGRAARFAIVVLSLIVVAEGIALGGLADPFGINKEPKFAYPAATATPSPTPSRPAYQFAPSSDRQVDGSLQCPDAGSVAAGRGDSKTQVVVLNESSDEPIMLLGPDRRVIIGKNAVMTGSVVMCGDGGTVLIVGRINAPVVMRGNNVKIVVQDGDKAKLPPVYSTSNGQVLICNTGKRNPSLPHCDNYLPRPTPKPSG